MTIGIYLIRHLSVEAFSLSLLQQGGPGSLCTLLIPLGKASWFLCWRESGILKPGPDTTCARPCRDIAASQLSQ